MTLYFHDFMQHKTIFYNYYSQPLNQMWGNAPYSTPNTVKYTGNICRSTYYIHRNSQRQYNL